MSREVIEHITWMRALLNLQLSGKGNASRFALVRKDDPGVRYPLRRSEDVLTLFIPNVTNLPGKEMLSEGRWFFASLDETGQPQPLLLSNTAREELASSERLFRYGKEHAAYLVTLASEGFGEQEACVLYTSFVKEPDYPFKERVATCLVHLPGKIADSYLRVLYAFLSHLHKHDGTHVLLMSETKAAIGGNLQALDRRIGERGFDKDYILTYSFQKTLFLSQFALLKVWSKLVATLAEQDLVFIDDYSPIFKRVKLKKCTKLIQVWHAGVGFKAVGYARFGEEGSPDASASSHRNYDYVVVGSRALIPVYQEVFALSADKFLPLGLPRIDSFLAKGMAQRAEGQIMKRYQNLKGKRRILFAPTYRGSGQERAFYPFELLDFGKIAEFCGNDTVFLIKKHPYVKNYPIISERYQDRIVDVSDEGIECLLYCADVLVTDYSSVIYEYSLLDRPMYFFAFDLEEYRAARGFQGDYERIIPGPLCRDLDGLLKALQVSDTYREERATFRKFSFDYEDTHNADRLIDVLMRV